MGRKIYFEMFGGRFLLRAYIPSLRRSFSKRSRSKITRLYIYIYIFSSIENFFSKIALLFEEGENRAFRTFARRSEKIRVRSRYGQDPGETAGVWEGENFRSIRLSNRSIVTPVFPSVLFIPATIVSLPLSVSSFNSRRTWIEGEGRAMMPEGMRGAHKRHLYPLQLAEL